MNYEQKRLIAESLRIAYEPPAEGWSCVANLVAYWLEHPESVPQPSKPPLRGLVYIENDGTIREATYNDI